MLFEGNETCDDIKVAYEHKIPATPEQMRALSHTSSKALLDTLYASNRIHLTLPTFGPYATRVRPYVST